MQRNKEESTMDKRGWRKNESMMSHKSSGMMVMKYLYPSKRFGEVIKWVDGTRDVAKHNATGFFPILNCKVLDVDMARMFGGDPSIQALIIFMADIIILLSSQPVREPLGRMGF